RRGACAARLSIEARTRGCPPCIAVAHSRASWEEWTASPMIDHVIPWASLLAACLAMAPLRELSEKDANRTFDVRIGERVSITLHAQLGTGYRWIARPAPRVALSERPLQGADRPGGEERQVFDVTPL